MFCMNSGLNIVLMRFITLVLERTDGSHLKHIKWLSSVNIKSLNASPSIFLDKIYVQNE